MFTESRQESSEPKGRDKNPLLRGGINFLNWFKWTLTLTNGLLYDFLSFKKASYYFYPQLFDQVSPEAKDLISRLLKVISSIPTPAFLRIACLYVI
jgi:hypothetical protein